MMNMLIHEGGKLMDRYLPANPKLRTLWNQYMTTPWDIWCIGLNMSTPCNISNNQNIESWHRSGIMRTVKTALKGSTATVLEHSFPKIVKRDGIV